MSEGKIYKAIPAIMAEIGAIAKTGKNESQGYRFRGIDETYKQLQPLLAKHGVFTTSEVLSDKHEERQSARGGALIYRILTMRYTFHADDGSNVQSVVVGEGMDSGDKASNKAMAVAHKYALLQVFAVPTEEAKDPENDSHEVVPKTDPVPEPDPRDTEEVLSLKREIGNCIKLLPDDHQKWIDEGKSYWATITDPAAYLEAIKGMRQRILKEISAIRGGKA